MKKCMMPGRMNRNFSTSIAVFALLLLSAGAFAQTDTAAARPSTATAPADTARVPAPGPLSFSGYAEVYYAYAPHNPKDNNLPSFYYNYNRHNEVNLNLAFAKAAYQTDRLRANLALGFGTYINANYAAESGTVKNLFEANVGIKISAKHNLWLDAGIMPSHIGFESAVGKDGWTLTRSLAAESSPYFESGARLSYSNNSGTWYLAALALNGWQRIARVPGNSLLSWGTQVTYKPNANLLFNYSTFIGTDSPDSTRQWRYFQDFYTVIQASPLVGITAGFDYGLQQKEKNSRSLRQWYTPVAIVRITPGTRWAFAARAEYYSDHYNLIVSHNSPDGFRSFGYSLNADYKPMDHVIIRLEAKQLNSRDEIYEKADLPLSQRFSVITAALAISF